MKTIKDYNFQGKRVLLRVDFNVPIEGGKVVDGTRIEASLPTIEYLLGHGVAKIIIATHLGRPDGKVVEELRLKPVAEWLAEKLGFEIKQEDDVYTIGPKIEMLENIRFDPREEKNEPSLAKELSQLAGVFVNDAFSCSHRAHVSVVGITKYLPSFAGPLLIREVENLTLAMHNPAAPVVVLIGGKKVEDKLPVIENLKTKILGAKFLIGGMVANELLTQKYYDPQVVLPPDGLPEGAIEGDPREIRDLGPKTIIQFKKIIASAKTIIWAGPMGKFEDKQYAQGTKEIAQAIVQSDAKTYIGGGDTIAAVNQFKIAEKISFISTGGSAFLEFLAGRKLPGIEALK